MKPTDEERREVAQKLRNMCCCGCRYAEQFYELLKETVMSSWDFHEYRDVAERLADLIEPAPERTCRPTHDRGRWECDECGCVIEPGFYPQFRGNGVLHYCPNCGAKVVR